MTANWADEGFTTQGMYQGRPNPVRKGVRGFAAGPRCVHTHYNFSQHDGCWVGTSITIRRDLRTLRAATVLVLREFVSMRTFKNPPLHRTGIIRIVDQYIGSISLGCFSLAKHICRVKLISL